MRGVAWSPDGGKSPMPPEQWGLVRDLFHRVLDLPPNDRAAFLKAECPDAEICAEVESLLLGAETNMFEEPALEGVRQAMSLAMPGGAAIPKGAAFVVVLVTATGISIDTVAWSPDRARLITGSVDDTAIV